MGVYSVIMKVTYHREYALCSKSAAKSAVQIHSIDNDVALYCYPQLRNSTWLTPAENLTGNMLPC